MRFGVICKWLDRFGGTRALVVARSRIASLQQAVRVNFDAAHETIECQEIEQSHERFGPLNYIGDGFSLKRVERPKRRDDSGQGPRIPAKILDKGGEQQRSSHEPEERQRGKRVNEEIYD